MFARAHPSLGTRSASRIMERRRRRTIKRYDREKSSGVPAKLRLWSAEGEGAIKGREGGKGRAWPPEMGNPSYSKGKFKYDNRIEGRDTDLNSWGRGEEKERESKWPSEVLHHRHKESKERRRKTGNAKNGNCRSPAAALNDRLQPQLNISTTMADPLEPMLDLTRRLPPSNIAKTLESLCSFALPPFRLPLLCLSLWLYRPSINISV